MFEEIEKTGVGLATQESIKRLLMPIFIKEYESENLNRNYLKQIKIKSSRKKVILSTTFEGMIDTTKHLYAVINALKKSRVNNKYVFLMSLMTARRIGEIIQLEYRDINFEKGIINPRPETTKTKKDGTSHSYPYPIPKEILETFDRNGEGKIFCGIINGYTKSYKKMIEKSDINVDYSLTSHTNRHFFQSIMSQYYDKDFVGEVVLSHTNQNMNTVYMTYNEEQIFTLYTKYWNIVRGVACDCLLRSLPHQTPSHIF